MSSKSRFFPTLCAFLTLVTLSLSSALLSGQTVGGTSTPKKIVSANAQATFLVAPAMSLKDAPSGVVATDLDGDGKPDLVVASSAAGKVSVSLGRGKGKFGAPVDYSVGGHPTAVVAVDVDGDGTKDIVTANGDDGTISVLRALAGGKLADAQIYKAGIDASFLVAAGDLNGDGKQDLIVLGKKANAFAILLNDGQGTLQKAVIQTLGKSPSAATVADLNGDKHLDVAVAYADGTVGTFLGAGDGSLRSDASFKAASSTVLSIVAGDFNGDGRVDLAMSERDGHMLSVFLGGPDGSFAKTASYKIGSQASSLVTIDLNGDGVQDLVSVNSGANTLSVLLGSGDGTFRSAPAVTVGNDPVAVATADFYGDGFPGFAVINSSASSANIIAGKGDGTFKAAPSYSSDFGPRAIASGDLNGDGLPDLVVSNFCGSDAKCSQPGSVSIYLAQKGGGYTAASTQAVGAGPVAVVLADVNGDGVLDVIALNRTDKSVSILRGVGDGTVQAASTFPLVGSPVAAIAKDLDGDGKLDLAVVSDCGSAKCSQRGSVDTYFGLGDGSFRVGSRTPVGYSPTSIVVGDLNGDGAADLIVANACGKDASCNSSGSATVLFGASGGTFTPQSDILLNHGPSSIALRTSNTSSKLDLVVSQETDNTVAVLSGNGDGSFKTPALYTVGNSPKSLVVADLNGDGLSDVAVANTKDSTVSVLYGQADGTLVSGDSYAVAAGPEALTAVPSAAGKLTGLVTANGNSKATAPGSEITSLSNLGPNAVTATTTTLSITPTSSMVNSAFTLQATVSPAPPDGEPITFSSDVGPLSDCGNSASLTAGMATCVTSQLTAGQRTVTASYGGDPTFDVSSDSEPQTVTPANATLSLTGPSTAPTVNQSATYTATLSGGPFTPTTPSGMVSFTITGQAGVSCPAVTLSGGTIMATCTVTPVAAGPISVFATYANDSNFNVAGQSNTVSQTVGSASATLTLTAPTASPTVNQSVTYTANLSSGSFTPTAPSGVVSFTVTGQNGVSCPNVTLSASSQTANCTFTPVAAGPISVVANYSSDPNFTATGQNNSVSQTVGAVAAMLGIATPSTSPMVNRSITYVATLGAGSGSFSPTSPSGTIAFTISGQQGLTCPATVVSSTTMTASCTFTPTAATSVTVSANYGGDANFNVANQPSIANQPVSPVAAMLTLPAPTATPTVNQAITYTATLGAGSGSFSPTAPSGSISFTITGQQGLSCQPSNVSASNMTASCTITPTAATSIVVMASYSNDANFTVANPPSTPSQSVSPSAATLTIAAPSAAPVVNTSTTYTATFAANSSSPTAPTGSIAFAISGQQGATCPSVLVSATNATANCTFIPTSATTVSVSASYVNDTNFSVASLPSTPSRTVNPVAATLSLSGPGMTTSVNQSVSFTATLGVGNSAFTPTAPSGSISFMVNSQTLPECPAVPVSGTLMSATCTTQKLVAPANAITAVYSGDVNYQVSNSPTLSQSVTAIAATTTVTPNSSSVVVNQPITFTARVQGSTPGPVVPAGSVTFSQGSTVLCNAVTLTNASSTSAAATCQTSFATANSTGYTVTAMYAPSGANFTAGTGATSSPVIVAPAATTTSLVIAPTPSVVDQLVTLTATIAPNPAYPGGSVPTGSVNFTDQTSTPAITLCSAAPVVSGTNATCSYAFLNQGPHSIVATFVPAPPSGGTVTNFATSSSSVVTQTVNAAPATLGVASSSTNAAVNQPVVFTATLTRSNSANTGTTSPQGTIAFTDGSSTTPFCTVTVTNGAAPSCPATTFATSGTHVITATYSGDPNFTSSPVLYNQVVSSASTSTQIALSVGNPGVNQVVTFAATVTATPSGSVFPQGTINLSDGLNSPLCSITVLNGSGSCQAAFLTQGTRTLSGSFQPSDSNFGASNFSSRVTVSPASTSVRVSSLTPNSSVNQQVTLTALVTPAFTSTNSTSPTGAVSFFAATTQLCQANVDATGNASCSTLIGSAATYQITAKYAGDANFVLSTSPAISQTVQPASTALTLTAASAQVIATQPSVFTATVSGSLVPGSQPPARSVSPGGSVTFTISLSGNPVNIGCAGVAVSTSGPPFTASCSIAFPTGTTTQYVVSATYTGDTNFSAPATPASTAETVGDFALNVPTATPILVTEGYTSATDPFHPVALTVTQIATNGFADPLSYACTVSPVLPTGASGLSCTLPSGVATPSFLFTASATATPGSYIATITATDTAFPNLIRKTTLPVQVGGTVPSFNLTSGATGTAVVPFPSGLAFTSFSCTARTLDGKTDPTSNFNISCSGPAGTSSGSGVTISIKTGPTSTSSILPASSNKYLAATCFALPVLLMAGARRKLWTKRMISVRPLGSLVLMIGLAQISGCGGGFSAPTVVTTSAPANTYQLDVIGNAGSSGTYHALVTLVVN